MTSVMYYTKRPGWLAVLVAVSLLAAAPGAGAEEAEVSASDTEADSIPMDAVGEGFPIEEVVVIGRQRAAVTDVVSERIESDVAMDMLDAEAIGRVGDSDVAAALRRVPGLTLVDDKFVYVRGLGERYSSAQLNGAQVPSPDLTRNVLPLDIFPTSIVDALAVHKGFAPELPAAFGGGNVNIRTLGAPLDSLLQVSLSSGINSDSSNGWTYSGGSDDKWGKDDGRRDLPAAISTAIQTYQGSFAPADVLTILRQDGGFHTLAEAEAVNRELVTSLNRNVDLREKDLSPDLQGEIAGGHRWFIGEDWELGFLALASYDYEWRTRERTVRRIANPETDFATTERTTEAVNITGALNGELKYTDEHTLKGMGLFLRNTEDDAALSLSCQQGQFNDCGAIGGGAQGRIADVRFEQRELEVGQISGSHELGERTLELLPDFVSQLKWLYGLQFNWYYSDAKASTDIPNEVRVGFVDTLDAGGAVQSTRIRRSGTAADFRFSELEDDVLSHGWDVMLPIRIDGLDLQVQGGYDYSRKARDYKQVSLGLGSNAPSFDAISNGAPSAVFSDANALNPDNAIALLLGVGGFGLESYFAALMNESGYLKLDGLYNETWRVSAGVRYEEFVQVSVPIDLLEFNGSRIPLTAQQIADGVIAEDDFYPAVSLTWIRPGFWSDEFQLRFGWSETTARPDIREVSASTYIDPLTEARVRGNPLVRSASLTNYDVRAEWYWDSGDNFTVSAFYKDITSPIETVQGGATEDNLLFTFINADSAELYGVEVEWLKSLGLLNRWLGSWTENFYLAGNVTWSDSDISIDAASGGVGNITNTSRPMSQQAEWVANLQLGYDSMNGKHGATLVYNVASERVFFAGINGFDDAYEQPFHALDFVYSFYPSEQLSLKFRVKNLLDESVEIRQQGVDLLEQTVGRTFLLDLKWQL